MQCCQGLFLYLSSSRSPGKHPVIIGEKALTAM
jgi:hypothetical protein